MTEPSLPFTDRACIVIKLARDEARRQRCDQVLSEHLLGALILEGDGIAGLALSKAGVSLGWRRSEDCRGLSEDEHNEWVCVGEKEAARFTGQAKQILINAADEGMRLYALLKPSVPDWFSDWFLNTEHLLLGLLLTTECSAWKLLQQDLAKVGLTPDDLRDEILRLIGVSPSPGA
ncbi:MAG: Clp protease N-terminal domain-containing protein [Pirellulales bacterium]